MRDIETTDIECPCCGEQIEVTVDCSEEHQQYVEDCSVCCRPIVITVITHDGELSSIDARSEND